MKTYSADMKLVMGSRRTVLGHRLPAATPLKVVDNPQVAGEVTGDVAAMLFGRGIAIELKDLRPTPHEIGAAEDEAEDVADVVEVADNEPDDDLLVWQEDEADLGKAKGDPVTKSDLQAIAGVEGVDLPSDMTKADIIASIMNARLG